MWKGGGTRNVCMNHVSVLGDGVIGVFFLHIVACNNAGVCSLWVDTYKLNKVCATNRCLQFVPENVWVFIHIIKNAHGIVVLGL